LPKAKADFKALMDAYDAQEALRLYDVMFRTSPEMSLLNEVLLVQRNVNWANMLQKEMGSHVYFMAVGAGHLGGEKGLIDLLRNAGYTVSPVIIQ
jgi:uncharacterized protein YbaP (TraB family)